MIPRGKSRWPGTKILSGEGEDVDAAARLFVAVLMVKRDVSISIIRLIDGDPVEGWVKVVIWSTFALSGGEVATAPG